MVFGGYLILCSYFMVIYILLHNEFSLITFRESFFFQEYESLAANPITCHYLKILQGKCHDFMQSFLFSTQTLFSS